VGVVEPSYYRKPQKLEFPGPPGVFMGGGGGTLSWKDTLLWDVFPCAVIDITHQLFGAAFVFEGDRGFGIVPLYHCT